MQRLLQGKTLEPLGITIREAQAKPVKLKVISGAERKIRDTIFLLGRRNKKIRNKKLVKIFIKKVK